MSYSFSVTAATKAEAKEKIAEEFDKVLASQPVHQVDRATTQAAAEAFVDMLVDPNEDQQVSVSVNGWVGWRAEGEFTSASGSVTASITAKL